MSNYVVGGGDGAGKGGMPNRLGRYNKNRL